MFLNPHLCLSAEPRQGRTYWRAAGRSLTTATNSDLPEASSISEPAFLCVRLVLQDGNGRRLALCLWTATSAQERGRTHSGPQQGTKWWQSSACDAKLLFTAVGQWHVLSKEQSVQQVFSSGPSLSLSICRPGASLGSSYPTRPWVSTPVPLACVRGDVQLPSLSLPWSCCARTALTRCVDQRASS